MLRVLRGMVPLLAACSSASDPEPEPAPALRIAERAGQPKTRGEVNPRLLRRFKPVRASIELANARASIELANAPASIELANAPPATTALTDLGRMLFFDQRLSKDGDLSCNSCHRRGRARATQPRVVTPR